MFKYKATSTQQTGMKPSHPLFLPLMMTSPTSMSNKHNQRNSQSDSWVSLKEGWGGATAGPLLAPSLPTTRTSADTKLTFISVLADGTWTSHVNSNNNNPKIIFVI